MGIRRWLSGTLRPDDVETDSITADSATVNGTTDTQALEAGGITDSADNQAWETLHEIGYESGDYVTIATFEPFAKVEYTTSSASYSTSTDICNVSVDWSSIVPSEIDTISVLMTAYVNGTGDVQLYNKNQSESMADAQGVSANSTTGFEKYTIPDKSNTDFLRTRIRTQNGNQVTLDTPQILFAIQL